MAVTTIDTGDGWPTYEWATTAPVFRQTLLLDGKQRAIRPGRPLDPDRVARAHDAALQDNGHHAGLADELAALVPCDRDRALAYLESSNPKNISFYQRHGFEIQGNIQAGSSPSIVPMLRRPR